MTIQENIDRINTAKADIKAAIERKGVTVGDALISEYASKIDQIETGGDYDEGFAAGYASGKTDGYASGVTDGERTGYQTGYEVGYGIGEADGYNEGYRRGYDTGRTDGFNEGYASGKTDGDAEGYNRGYSEGRADGYASGKTDGYNEGFQSGYTTGIIDAKGDMISTSITENGTYTREEGFNSVEVNVQGGEVAMTHFAINLTPANIDSTVSVSANGETHTYHNETGRIEFDLYGGLEYTISFGSVSGYYAPMDITGISMYAASNEYSVTYERSVATDYIAMYYNVTSTTMACEIIPNPIEGEYISIDGGDWTPAIRDYTFNTEGEHYVLYKNTNVGFENIIRGNLFKRYSAYYERQWMYKVIIPDTITEIGESAFESSVGLTSVTIGNSVTTISSYAFHNCSGLTSIVIPDSVTTIGGSVFYRCTNLASITIPDSVTSIAGSAFAFCSSLTSITIPDSVTRIEWYTFQDCSSLTSITISDSVTTIGTSAFKNNTSLQSIICKATIAPSVKINSFDGIRNSGVLYVPEGSDYSKWLSNLPSGWVIQRINS